MFRDKIRQTYEYLAPSYRKVADFLLHSYYEAAFMTASRLAIHLEIDTATVVRFAQRLGYAGYPDLLHEIQALVRSEMAKLYQPENLLEDTHDLAQRILASEQGDIERVTTQNSPAVLTKAAQALRKATCIFVVAEGDARYIGLLASQILVRAGLNVRGMDEDMLDRASHLAHARSTDVVLGLSTSLYDPGIATVVEVARARGLTTIGLTDSLSNPLARAAEIVIVAPVNQLTPYHSLTSLNAVVSTLCQVAIHGEQKSEGQKAFSFKVEALILKLADGQQQGSSQLMTLIEHARSSDEGTGAQRGEKDQGVADNT